MPVSLVKIITFWHLIYFSSAPTFAECDASKNFKKTPGRAEWQLKITWNGDWNTLEVWCFLLKEVQFSEKAIPCVQSHDFYWDNKTIRWTRSIITLQWEWPKENFSVQYQYNNKQKCNENKERYKLETCKLIQYQILQINTLRIVWQAARKISSEIFRVKGLNFCNTDGTL